MHLKITPDVSEAIVAAARRAAPLEACGLCGGAGGRATRFYELTNVDAATDHFAMAPAEQLAAVRDMRQHGTGLVAIWHSHPASAARLSAEDLRLAFTPDVVHLVLSLANPAVPRLAGYTVMAGRPRPVRLERDGGEEDAT